jgi:hypothetical protein
MKVNETQFIVGNIGPDCGEPNEDWSVFNPPATISHWTKTGMKRDIDSQGFYQEYIEHNTDEEKLSFYLGYYVHLLTDILWVEEIHLPTKEKFQKEFEKDKDFIWKVKEDWSDQDHLFLLSHPDFRAFHIFETVKEFPNVYLSYYSPTAIEKQILHISGFYNSHEGNLNREYPYLNKEQADNFVELALGKIYKDLKYKNLTVR